MDTKEDLLKRAGYRYNFDRMAYINRDARKVFSVEAIEDHSAEWLCDRIAETNNGEWRFYFNEAPSPSVVRDFLSDLGERRAAG
ncbi:MAG TPA: hypothetical protein VNA69_18775 [Thermoanaerobaculia bacterium]|nr:hypothetical protein [Thermoanaerobaculia bacterium]